MTNNRIYITFFLSQNVLVGLKLIYNHLNVKEEYFLFLCRLQHGVCIMSDGFAVLGWFTDFKTFLLQYSCS